MLAPAVSPAHFPTRPLYLVKLGHSAKWEVKVANRVRQAAIPQEMAQIDAFRVHRIMLALTLPKTLNLVWRGHFRLKDQAFVSDAPLKDS